MALFEKKHEHTGKTVAVFDVGSASVGVALATLRKSGKPRVVYHTRRDMAFQHDLDFDRFVASMTESLEAVAEELSTKGVTYLNQETAHIDDVVVIYASPWYTTSTRVLDRKSEKPFDVNEKTVEDLIAAEVQKKGKKKEDEVGQIVERKITSIELNGYPVKDLSKGLVAKHLRVAVSATMIPAAVIDTVEKLLGGVAVNSTISHQSFAMVAFTSVRDIFHAVSDFLVIDVSGEVCDIIFAKKDSLLETASFPKGRMYLYRELQRTMGTDVHTVKGTLSAHAKDGLSASAKQDLTEALAPVQKEWEKSFGNAIERFFHEMTLPSTMFFISSKDVSKVFQAFIEESHAEGLFDARHLQPVVLREHVAFPERGVGDAFLGLGVYFAKRLLMP